MILFKAGVRVKRLTPALLRILNVLYQEHSSEPRAGPRFPGQPDDLGVTSINDSEHLRGSRHYVDEALDLRSFNFPSREAKRAWRTHRAGLMPEFTVLLEGEGTPSEHFHIQPRKDTTYP